MLKKERSHIALFLSEVPFFSEVSQTSLMHLCEEAVKETYISGNRIFQKGDSGEEMYVLLSGRVRVHDKQHVYDYLSKGDCFGEYAIIDSEVRSASITTEETAEVLKIARHHVLNLMKTDSGFAQGILAVMIKRHRELDVIQERLAVSKQEVELANAKMSGLIDGAMDAIVMFNSEFRIVLTNPSAELLLENNDVLQRNVLFFMDEDSAAMIKGIVQTNIEDSTKKLNTYLPKVIKVIGSNETETLNEGTISNYGNGAAVFYTLILRNLTDRLQAEDTINLLTTQTQYLEEEIKKLTNDYGILTEDKSMKTVLDLIHQVATTDATALITGETGTGKELVARAIHQESSRRDQPLIRINCGAIPANLIESELFGHEKGAFTGATISRKGRFLLADKGTIFLDEIGEMPLELQPKLLRVIQEGEFDPVGSSTTIKVDVRIIAATHRDLLQHAKDGKFREDLYYRLNVFPIEIPALRVRGNDINLIAAEMLKQFSIKLNKPQPILSAADKKIFTAYNWPGNVRELQNLIERAVIVSQKGKIDWKRIVPSKQGKINLQDDKEVLERVWTSQEIINLEKENILRALRQTKWRISGKTGAAQLLQLPPTTLASKIKAHGIERPI